MKQQLTNLIRHIPGYHAARAYMHARQEKQLIQQMDHSGEAKDQAIVVNSENVLQLNYQAELDYFKKMSSRFNRVVVWGFKEHFHTHRFIHKHFYENLVKLGAKTLWLEDLKENEQRVESNDLVFAMDQASEFLPFRNDVNYCLHNLKAPAEKKCRVVYLQVYTKQLNPEAEQWEASTFFAREERMLFQAWGTDLLPHEFHPPVFNDRSKDVYWIGSIWNNALNQGNEQEIISLRKSLAKHGLEFKHLEKVSVEKNIEAVRSSRLAPAISGNFQVEVDYLPCRVFKNVSYGSPAITNVSRFGQLFGAHHLRAKNIDELVALALELSEQQWLDMTLEQQKVVAGSQTYLHKLNRIFRAFDELY